MHFNSLLTAAVMVGSSVTAVMAAPQAAAAPAVKYMTGLNLGTNTKSGACKTQADWEADFKAIKVDYSKGLNYQWDHVKLFTTNDCNALDHAVPAALKVGMKIWAGVWAHDGNKFNAEKGALESAIKKYGDATKWLAGINVGSESLYRKEMPAWTLAERIYDVKGMVQIAYGLKTIPVGTADTWTSWEHPDNKPVIDAVDVVLMNGFPYWEGATVAQGLDKLKEAIAKTKAHTGSKPFVIGETGWPTFGPKFGSATASKANAQAYWKAAGCYLISQQIPFFWFSAFNEPKRESVIEQNFGVGYSNRVLFVDFKC
ncbi:glycoside hydrolase [Ascobolus immersus RN42]|uniref:Probable glucan endo-1,3-beta-glucosidase eglC n=1 Tax=Ascobolus immersus RN42 TaxID=1160509 RepID=A0A3N4IFW7_ASCIM|nr:glycoside hydrolase [Ascobolus immersus RN42]